MNRIVLTALFVGLLAALAPGPADAEVIINIVQSGANVVMSGSGTLDTTDLSNSGGTSSVAVVGGADAAIRLGSTTGASYVLWSGITGPSNFGTGYNTAADSGSGDAFGGIGMYGYLYTPGGYTSGASLSGTDTFDSTTIAGLGLTSGTYTYTWGTGAHADMLVINIPSTVPEPSTVLMMGMGLAVAAGSAYARRRRNRATVA